jgi:arsenate reductase
VKGLLVCYPKCSTCKKAEKFLKDHNFEYDYRDIKEDNPNKEEIKKWHELSGLDIKKFFNTSGQVYRNLGLKDKLKSMSLEEKYELLASDGMLVKRPILIIGDKVTVAFKEDYREEFIK